MIASILYLLLRWLGHSSRCFSYQLHQLRAGMLALLQVVVETVNLIHFEFQPRESFLGLICLMVTFFGEQRTIQEALGRLPEVRVELQALLHQTRQMLVRILEFLVELDSIQLLVAQLAHKFLRTLG
uniref:Uncharacterized protein n=1 Tax=Strombidium inclinatum TaxID=197538 RepID=A0A7S3J193_9SPIT